MKWRGQVLVWNNSSGSKVGTQLLVYGNDVNILGRSISNIKKKAEDLIVGRRLV
jgi:hypothetical protein